MKYTVFYERKVPVRDYNMLTVGLSMEFDETTDPNDAFNLVKADVEAWIQKETGRLAEAPTTKPEAPTPEAKPEPRKPIPDTEAANAEWVEAMFPPDLREMLVFEQSGNFVEITPRRYLGSENFAKIATIVRDNDGEYVSAGKDSYFRIPITQTETKAIPEFDAQELMAHKWKGKKTGEGQYAQGSLNWGWDWKEKFSQAVLDVLAKGPLTIDKHEFVLQGRIVQVGRVKD